MAVTAPIKKAPLPMETCYPQDKTHTLPSYYVGYKIGKAQYTTHAYIPAASNLAKLAERHARMLAGRLAAADSHKRDFTIIVSYLAATVIVA